MGRRKAIRKIYTKHFPYPQNSNSVFDINPRIDSGSQYGTLFRPTGYSTVKSNAPSAEIDLREPIQRSSG